MWRLKCAAIIFRQQKQHKLLLHSEHFVKTTLSRLENYNQRNNYSTVLSAAFRSNSISIMKVRSTSRSNFPFLISAHSCSLFSTSTEKSSGKKPLEVYRSNYCPSSFSIDTVHMNFQLDIESTVVTTLSTFTRHNITDLRLDGNVHYKECM